MQLARRQGSGTEQHSKQSRNRLCRDGRLRPSREQSERVVAQAAQDRITGEFE